MSVLASLLAATVLTAPAAAPTPTPSATPPTAPTPAQHLGRPVGTDFELADYAQVIAYYERLAAASPNLLLKSAGLTTEGRALRYVVISDAANLARLDELKGLARAIADPRGLSPAERARTLADSKLFLFISNNMHSTEIASVEMSMELAYLLATSREEPFASARRELVVIMTPSTNPDGFDRVVRWYHQVKGTPYETARLPELYQWYAGHDNNRDWFMLSLAETRLITKLLYHEWFPQVYWDVHQQGQVYDRLFFPPFRDPLNPNLDATVMAGIGAVGSRVMLDMTRAGFTGVATGINFDMWWNGGNRNVPVRHNMMGFLSETASANLASPRYVAPEALRPPGHLATTGPSNLMPSPWRGGWWRIGDIIRYELGVARSLLATLSREPESWRALVLEAAERASREGLAEAPYAWVIPPGARDRGAVRRLVDTLLLQGVELEIADAPFTADALEYPAGTLILRRAQPYGRFLKDLFEIQRYPGGMRPYDVAGWTLPLLMGVHRVEVAEPFVATAHRVADVAAIMKAQGDNAPAPAPYPWPHLRGDDSDSLRAVVQLLAADVPVIYDADRDSPGAGAWVIPRVKLAKARRVLKDQQLDVSIQPARKRGSERAGALSLPRRAPEMLELDALPRVGLYAPWTANMDEGWIRWVFDEFKLPYTRVRNATMRAGNLRERFDVLVLPSIHPDTLRHGRAEGSVFPRFAGGLDPEGAMALHDFVHRGGTLIAIARAGDYVNEVFDLGLRDAAARAGRAPDEAFACPGSVLRTLPERASPWAAGLPPSQPVFFARSRAWALEQDEKDTSKPDAAAPRVEPVLRFPSAGALLSGWIQHPEQIADTWAWVRARVGDGQIHVFGVRPTYRSWTQASFALLFRAMLLPPDIEVVDGVARREPSADNGRFRAAARPRP